MLSPPSSLQPSEQGPSPSSQLLVLGDPLPPPQTQWALLRALFQKSPASPPAATFQISLQVQKPLVESLIPTGFFKS